MNAAETSWTARRWSTVLSIMVLGHVGIFWLAARPPSAPSISPGRLPVIARWAEAAPDPLAGGTAVPTRFALPGNGGFSADAGSGLPRVAYGIPIPRGTPRFLPANPDAGHLGRIPNTANPVGNPVRTVPDAAIGVTVEPVAADQGSVEVSGLPAGIAPRREINVPVWTDSAAPQPTRIEFAVNPFGEVVTARLTLTSGSRTADLAALAALRGARFTARRDAHTAETLSADRFSWGVATFHPIATNANATAPQAR